MNQNPNMKTNLETNMNSDIITTAAPKASRRGQGLKAAVVILSLAALWLSYRAANEAAALHGILEKVQAALSHEQSVKAQAATAVQISETKSSVAGL